ncbi:hypothetical protein F5Y13DRAFT_149286 [Hypoxylon sp. FL1857]|nr:hypothetical protein F5Y13DRAFT_149286 [Hypoxylon sp. FL1857]
MCVTRHILLIAEIIRLFGCALICKLSMIEIAWVVPHNNESRGSLGIAVIVFRINGNSIDLSSLGLMGILSLLVTKWWLRYLP